MDLKCEVCDRELVRRDGDAVMPGDVFEAAADNTRVYDWRGATNGVLCKLDKGTRLTLVDQFPPGWWKVALQAGRWRAVVDPDVIVYPDLNNGDYVRVAATCAACLSPITEKIRQSTEWWRR